MAEKKTKKKDSKLSIAAAITALFIFTIPIGFILAIVDLIKSKGDKSQRHLGSYFAIVSFVLFLIVAFSNGSGNNSNNVNATKQASATQQDTDTATNDDTTLKYLKHEVITDSNDREVVVVYFDFTNNSKDNEAFIYNYNVTCFQNDKELDYPLASFDIDEYNNAARELQTGANITVARIYILEDKSDIDLEVTAWGSSKKLMKLTLKAE
ncbi:DUF5067 domain-containing protein [Pseudoruminococcus massiliensis]|uniref:DUF5067 domain-containing protein n=1 Tax=Pseudoruminococcus massiliensis TaxID=2086583 RepID=UPI003AB7E58D